MDPEQLQEIMLFWKNIPVRYLLPIPYLMINAK